MVKTMTPMTDNIDSMLRSKDPLIVSYGWQFPFERSFDGEWATAWMQANWKLSISASFVYVCTIFIVRQYMESRSRYQLKQPLIIWNVGLAIFSIIGAIRMLPEFVASIREGPEYSACNNSYTQGVPFFWAWVFGLSKVAELGDTMFIVLRKQSLIFLHWYHHITVMIYTWYSIQQQTGSGRWFITMNMIVHSFMYSYYALRACGIRLPRWTPWSITVMQLLQMFIGCGINIYSYGVKLQSRRCDQTYTNLNAALLMYASYFALFGHFFYTNYYTPQGKFTGKHTGDTAGVTSNGEKYTTHDKHQNGEINNNNVIRKKAD